MSGILVQNLTKKFGDFVAVDDVTFEVEEGELVALLGPSGSGKSTILRIIAGLEKQDTGQIFLTDKDVTVEKAQKRHVGFVFQHYALFKHMTVEKNIAFGLQIQKRDKQQIREKVAELIDLVKLNGYERHYPSQLSGGQRQRVALARALAPEPRVLLLDEPFGALDAKVRKNLSQWLRGLHDRIQVTSIFVTHDQNEAMEISDKIIVVNRGKIEQTGSAVEVYEQPQTKFVASFVGNVNVLDAVFENNQAIISGSTAAISLNGQSDPAYRTIVLLVRPEDIDISREKRNTLDTIPAQICGIHYRGSFYEIDLKLGTTMVKSTVEKDRFMKSNWRMGEPTFVYFKKFKIFEAAEGHRQIRTMLKQLGYIE